MKIRFLKYPALALCLGITALLIISSRGSCDFVKLSFLDVGQGDGTLININNKNIILIDGGPDNLVLRSLGGELPFYKRKIDMVVVSHFHNDHIVGLVEIFRRYKVDNLVYGKDLKKFQPHGLLFSEAEKQGTRVIPLEKYININLDSSCSLKIIHPHVLAVDNDNDSLITKLTCNNFSFLASGDNEAAVERAMVEKMEDISAQVFKASHHGSKTSNSKDLLSLIKPMLVVVSAGINNTFGHPAPEVISSLLELGITWKETSQEGTISIWVDLQP